MKNGPDLQCPPRPMPHFMFRSMERNIRSSRTPRAWSSRTVKRIITSGPQTRATLLAGSKGARGMRVVTTPTLPRQLPAAASTVTSTSRSIRLRPRPPRPHRVRQEVDPAGVSADRDGDLADPEDVEHVELPRCEPGFVRRRHRLQVHRDGVAGLAARPADGAQARHHGAD